MKYILITPAYNEEKYIRGTIESVINQEIKPAQWIIVNDGSSDSTGDIIGEYLDRYDFMTYVRFENRDRITSNLGKVSIKVVSCVKEGLKHVKDSDYDLIGILDSDITFGPGLFSGLISKFHENKNLGLTDGVIYNVTGDKKWLCFGNKSIVGGANQLFRKACWDQIGGLYPGGHHDYYSSVSCRMHGWEVRAAPELEVYHHKHASVAGRSQIRAKFHLGQMDYVCGEMFLYSFLRSISLIKSKPVVTGCFLRIAGYLYAMVLRKPHQIPNELRTYLKKEQFDKLKQILKWKVKQ